MITYRINFTSSTKTPFAIAPGEYDGPNHLIESPPQPLKAHTSLNLPGAGAIRYGELINEDLIRLLENFYDQTPPPVPTFGQIWVDSSKGRAHVFTKNNTWVQMPGFNVDPVEAIDGDLLVKENGAYIFFNGKYNYIHTSDDINSDDWGIIVDPSIDWIDYGFVDQFTTVPDEDYGDVSESPDGVYDWGVLAEEYMDFSDYGFVDQSTTESDEDYGDVTETPNISYDWGFVVESNLESLDYGFVDQLALESDEDEGDVTNITDVIVDWGLV